MWFSLVGNSRQTLTVLNYLNQLVRINKNWAIGLLMMKLRDDYNFNLIVRTVVVIITIEREPITKSDYFFPYGKSLIIIIFTKKIYRYS